MSPQTAGGLVKDRKREKRVTTGGEDAAISDVLKPREWRLEHFMTIVSSNANIDFVGDKGRVAVKWEKDSTYRALFSTPSCSLSSQRPDIHQLAPTVATTTVGGAAEKKMTPTPTAARFQSKQLEWM